MRVPPTDEKNSPRWPKGTPWPINRLSWGLWYGVEIYGLILRSHPKLVWGFTGWHASQIATIILKTSPVWNTFLCKSNQITVSDPDKATRISTLFRLRYPSFSFFFYWSFVYVCDIEHLLNKWIFRGYLKIVWKKKRIEENYTRPKIDYWIIIFFIFSNSLVLIW